MFGNLVESGSHTQDFKRRGAFFLGTCALYAVLTLAAGVGSIYAYNTHLDQRNLELVTLVAHVPFRPQTQVREPRRGAQKQRATGERLGDRAAVVREISRNTPFTPSGKVASADTPELKRGTSFVIGDSNLPVSQAGSPTGSMRVGGSSGDFGGRDDIPPQSVRIAEDEQPPPLPRVAPRATSAHDKISVSSSVLSGKAISKPIPAYPLIAKTSRVSGTVAVQVLVDEGGRVISAQATSGHPLLQQAAVRAAYEARFTPTRLSGHAVKVSGIITYNFVLQ